MCHNSILRYRCGHQSIGRYTVTCLNPSTCSGPVDGTHFFNVEIRCPDCDANSDTLFMGLGGIQRPDPQTVLPGPLLTFPLPNPHEDLGLGQSARLGENTTVDNPEADEFPPPRRSSPRLILLSQSPSPPSSPTPLLSTTLPRRYPWETDRGILIGRARSDNDTDYRVAGNGLRPLPVPPTGLFDPRGMLARTRQNQPSLSAMVAESTDSDTDNDAPAFSRISPRGTFSQPGQLVMTPARQFQTLSTAGEPPAQTAPRDPWEALQRQYATFHAEQNELQREEHDRRQDEESREHPERDLEDKH